MLRFLKEYFSLSNNEQRGIIGLLLIILFVFGGSRMYFMYKVPKEIPQDNTHLLLLLEEQEKVNSEKETISTSNEGQIEIHFFKFDPNIASKEDLINLGFKENVAVTLINFRSKGGKFYQKEDLKKVYGVDENFYAKLESYIDIPPKVYPKKESNFVNKYMTKETSSSTKSLEKAVNIELNTADSATLTFIRGIGPAFSSRIIKYRDLLGGFREKEQLLEVYGITPEVYEGIKDQVIVSGEIRKLNVNQVSWYDLKNHPYINSELANILLNYKKAHGKIENFNFLLESKLISKEEFDKLTPYLSIQ